MKRTLAVLVIIYCFPAAAREGFSVGIGIGGGIWSLSESSLNSSLRDINRSDGRRLTETLDDGLAIRFDMAYNIKGYASVELGITGHGWKLGGDDIGGSGHVSVVAHFHPLQFWLPERDFDATVFLGGGYSIIGGGHADGNLNRGMDGGLLECGFTGSYYFTPWFSAGVQIRFSVPFYNRWVVDWGDEDYSLSSSPSALFTTILATSTFHFQAGS
jgi:hypothetical protein